MKPLLGCIADDFTGGIDAVVIANHGPVVSGATLEAAFKLDI